MLTDAAVPVWSVLLVEELLDIFRDLFLSFFGVDGFVYLLLDVVLHILVHLADYPLHITLGHLYLII